MKIHLTLRQALRLYELAKEANDVDLCNVADKVIGPKTCTSCGTVNEAVVPIKSSSHSSYRTIFLCRACYKARASLEDRM
jgi:hypothetical protein